MTGKRKSPAFRIMLLLLLLSVAVCAQNVNTVVIDAGHGGHDTGALGKNSREKDITLSIALQLRDYIKQNLPEVKVVMTREKDVFVELYRRARIANESNADIFISLHCNSTKSPIPFGTETFVMGLHKSDANLAVAKAENAAILLEDDYVSRYDGFDPNSPEGNIFFSMMQNAFLNSSLDFAGRVQANFRERVKMYDRGVKQAGFLVLYKTAMPGVLIECGFLSNAADEKFLLSTKGQAQIAYSIYRSLLEYKNGTGRKEPSVAAANDTMPDLPPTAGNINDKSPELKQITETSGESKPMQASLTTGVRFRVQFALYPSEKPVESPEFKGLEKVKYYKHNNMFKYTTGDEPDLESAMKLRQTVVAKGFKDAFVVPFLNEKRITIEEAKRLTGN